MYNFSVSIPKAIRVLILSGTSSTTDLYTCLQYIRSVFGTHPREIIKCNMQLGLRDLYVVARMCMLLNYRGA